MTDKKQLEPVPQMQISADQLFAKIGRLDITIENLERVIQQKNTEIAGLQAEIVSLTPKDKKD